MSVRALNVRCLLIPPRPHSSSPIPPHPIPLLSSLDFAAMTWGQPSFFFVGVKASRVATIDQSCNMCDGAPPANMALQFTVGV